MSRKYMIDRWCVRCGRKTPTPYLVKIARKLALESFWRARRVALDLGCGNGRNSAYLNKLGYSVTAVDACGGAPDAKRCVLGADRLPTKTGTASLILLNYTLMFLNDVERQQLAAEIKRVALRNYPGCLVLIEMYPAKDSYCTTADACQLALDTFAEQLLCDRGTVCGSVVQKEKNRCTLWLR